MLNTKHHLNTVLGLITLCVLLVVLSFPTFAKETQIRVGTLKITPGIKYKGTYQKNVFFEQNDERDDYIHTLTPKILFEYAGGTLGNYLTAGYEIDLVAYDDYDQNNYQAHRPWVSLAVNNLGPFYLKVNESYTYTADPFGSANTYGLGNKTKRWNNRLDVTLGRKLSDKYALELMYDNYLERFREDRDKWQNRIDHRFGASFFVKVASKTVLFGQYRRTLAEYDEQNNGDIPAMVFPPPTNWTSSTSQDYILDDYFVGARFHPSGRLSGEIKFGWGEKRWQNDLDPYGNSYIDEDTWIAEANVHYILKKNASVDVDLHRSFLGASDFNSPGPPAPVTLVSSGYVDTKAGILYTHNLNRTTFRIGFDYNLHDYQNEAPGFPKKYFNRYTFKTGLDYRVRDWLIAGVEYKYQDKDASDDVYSVNEYTDNTFSFSADVAF